MLVSVLDTTLDSQVALFVDEQTLEAASDETAASSVELARLGNQLQMMVSQFRV